jgi:non-homologous end joining protein Ku
MIELASHILGTKAAHFDPSKFNDEYENAQGTGAAQGSRQADQGKRMRGEAGQRRQPDEGKTAAKRRASAPRRPPARRAAKKAHRSAARQRKAG